jgi:hypothetical protein
VVRLLLLQGWWHILRRPLLAKALWCPKHRWLLLLLLRLHGWQHQGGVALRVVLLAVPMAPRALQLRLNC